jgi:protein-S-isoprenylcysteine O-methyltransferase Ste14
MTRFASLLYGAAAYGASMLTVLYAIGFVANFGVPKGIDDGAVVPLAEALLVNTLLLALFAVQHSVMARPGFKAWWTKVVPEPIERSTFVAFASLSLMLLFWQWRPMPAMLWWIENPTAAAAVQGLSLAGWGIVLLSTFLISHFELFGLTQVVRNWLGRSTPEPVFHTPMLYKHVRHPLYFGFLIAFWAAPTMTAGHLFFAVVTTAYILIAIQLEERDLVAVFGARYIEYRERVAMIIPGLRFGRGAGADQRFTPVPSASKR